MFLVALTLAASVGACAGPPGRSGGDPAPVALRSVYGNGVSGVGSDISAAIAAASARGAVAIASPVLPQGGSPDDTDGAALAVLRAGRSDVAVIRAPALVAAGATSLAPLQAPFVVQSDDQATRVAADPIAGEMLAGLRRIGLVGLALVPGGLRHPFGYKDPLRGPADYRGAVINVRRGGGPEDIIRALGAVPDYAVDDLRRARVKSGALRGIEVAFGQFGAVDGPAVVTSNVTLYEKFDVVVIRRSVYDTLSRAQRDALHRAVGTGVARALAQRRDEAGGLREWCGRVDGSSIVVPAATVAALRAATAPVLAAINGDARAAAIVARMRALGDGLAPAPGATCAGPTSTDLTAYAVSPVGNQHVLDGTWRIAVDKDALVAAGVPIHDAEANAGIWTLRIRKGRAEVDQPNGDPCLFQFSFARNRVGLVQDAEGNEHCGGHGAGTFRRRGDVVTFRWQTQLDYGVVLDQAMFHEMRRIGD
jgi:TRAP-type C4-dicarboxylate transport system substrate-binding protein